MSVIERVAVIGGGLMGSGIAEVCARAGLDVVVVESNDEAAKAALSRLEKSLHRAADRGKHRQRRGGPRADPVRDRPRGRSPTASSSSRRSSRTRPRRSTLFKRLDEIVTDPDAILASNTSSIPIMKLAVVTVATRSRCIGIHFFNPVPVLQAGRAGPVADDLGRDRCSARASCVEGPLEKQAIDCQDRAGFVVNALLIPFILSAIRMYESGFASAEDIDQRPGARCRAPAGPARAGRPDRPRHDQGRRPSRCTRSSRSRCTPPRRCWTAWSTPACSAARPGAASTPTK